jgi:hypothetical protein
LPLMSRSPMRSGRPAPVGRSAMRVSPVKITIRFSMSCLNWQPLRALRSPITAGSGLRHYHEVRSPKPSTTSHYRSRPARACRSAWGLCCGSGPQEGRRRNALFAGNQSAPP